MSLVIWDHTVLPSTRHKWTPRLNPSQTGWYLIYLPLSDGRLSWPRWPVCVCHCGAGTQSYRSATRQLVTWDHRPAHNVVTRWRASGSERHWNISISCFLTTRNLFHSTSLSSTPRLIRCRYIPSIKWHSHRGGAMNWRLIKCRLFESPQLAFSQSVYTVSQKNVILFYSSRAKFVAKEEYMRSV